MEDTSAYMEDTSAYMEDSKPLPVIGDINFQQAGGNVNRPPGMYSVATQ